MIKRMILTTLMSCLCCSHLAAEENGELKLKKVQREEPSSEYYGKKDIVEYFRNKELILSIIKIHRKDGEGIRSAEQNVFFKKKKVLTVMETKHKTQPKHVQSWDFLGGDPNTVVKLLFDKDRPSTGLVIIAGRKEERVYDAFKVEKDLLIPYSAVELRKLNKASEAIMDILGELTKTHDSKAIMEKMRKHKAELDKIK